MKQVIIEISKQGATKVSVDGVAGPSCRDLTRSIEDALGRVSTIEPTPEYHQQQEQAEGQGAGLA